MAVEQIRGQRKVSRAQHHLSDVPNPKVKLPRPSMLTYKITHTFVHAAYIGGQNGTKYSGEKDIRLMYGKRENPVRLSVPAMCPCPPF